MLKTKRIYVNKQSNIMGDSGGKVNIFGSATIGHCEEEVDTLRTGDADLRFYVTTVQDG